MTSTVGPLWRVVFNNNGQGTKSTSYAGFEPPIAWECLLEFDTRSYDPSHHGWILSSLCSLSYETFKSLLFPNVLSLDADAADSHALDNTRLNTKDTLYFLF